MVDAGLTPACHDSPNHIITSCLVAFSPRSPQRTRRIRRPDKAKAPKVGAFRARSAAERG